MSVGIASRIDGKYATLTLKGADLLYDMLRDYKPDIVTVETFFTAGRVGVAMIRTIEMVGGVRAACRVLGVPCYGQTPGARVARVDDAKTVFASVHGHRPIMTKDQDDHEISALAHLLTLEHRIKTNTVKDEGTWRFVAGGR